jgi:hypothetical protein
MKVRFLAFRVGCDGAMTLSQLMEFVSTQDSHRFMRYDRLLRVTEADGYYLGVVITSKQHRKTPELSVDDLVVSVRDIEEGKNAMDFNFFVINTKTGRGLYQHYHQSLRLQSFGGLLDSQMKRLVERQAKAAIAQAETTRNITERQKAALRTQFRTKLHLAQLAREAELPDLVRGMERIKRLRYEVAYIEEPGSKLEPLTGLVKISRREFVFNREATIEKLRDGVLAVVRAVSPSKGKIVGEDAEGEEQILSLLENYDVFGELEYDEAVSTVHRMKVSDFASSPMIKRLLDTVKANRAAFEARERS